MHPGMGTVALAETSSGTSAASVPSWRDCRRPPGRAKTSVEPVTHRRDRLENRPGPLESARVHRPPSPPRRASAVSGRGAQRRRSLAAGGVDPLRAPPRDGGKTGNAEPPDEWRIRSAKAAKGGGARHHLRSARSCALRELLRGMGARPARQAAAKPRPAGPGRPVFSGRSFQAKEAPIRHAADADS